MSSSAADVREVLALIDAATKADHNAPIDEQAVRSLTVATDARHVFHREDDRIVAYANISPAEQPMAEVVVAPAARNRGIGTTLVAELVDTGAWVWAHGNLPAAQAVAQRLELKIARALLQLRRDVADLPEIELPQGISIRTYADGDDAEILRVNNAAFSWHPEQGGWTESDIAERRAERWFDPDGLFVATDEAGRVVGFHWTKVHSEGGEVLGEVYVVGVDPAAQGKGLGRALTLAGLHHLRIVGVSTVMLYTEADNSAAVRTYEGLGFRRFHTDVAYSR